MKNQGVKDMRQPISCTLGGGVIALSSPLSQMLQAEGWEMLLVRLPLWVASIPSVPTLCEDRQQRAELFGKKAPG